MFISYSHVYCYMMTNNIMNTHNNNNKRYNINIKSH